MKRTYTAIELLIMDNTNHLAKCEDKIERAKLLEVRAQLYSELYTERGAVDGQLDTGWKEN